MVPKEAEQAEMTHPVQINPRMLSWARETAGLSVAEAAAMLGLKTTAKVSAEEKLRQVEAGARAVSHGLLEKAVAAYRRPLIAFYLPQPPARGDRGEDFRTVSGAVSPRDEALLDALLRDVRARQQMLREVVADDEDARALPFVASARVDEGATHVAACIRATLGVSVADQRRAKDSAGLFCRLRAAAERAGVFVLLVGDLGSHHSDIGEDVFRGFALADDLAPFVVINDNDAVPARAFTLVHELAHIWIGATGVSGPLRGVPENAVERFCNEVAGEFLLPADAVAGLAAARGADVARAGADGRGRPRLEGVPRCRHLSSARERVAFRGGRRGAVPYVCRAMADGAPAGPTHQGAGRDRAWLLHRSTLSAGRGVARHRAPGAPGRHADPYQGRPYPGRDPYRSGPAAGRTPTRRMTL